MNVPINFPTNTVGLQEANKLLLQSKAATDALRQSTKQMGTDTQALGAAYKTTLQGMTEQLERLKFRIQNTAASNKEQLSKLSAEYANVKKQIDDMNKSLFNQQAASQAANSGLTGLLNTAKLLIAVKLAQEMGEIALNLAVMKGNAEGVEKAFQRLPNSVLLLNQLRRATHGTVEDLVLMQKAIQFNNFRLPLQDLGKYLEFASIRAQQTGESVDYMVNSIVLGLGRGTIKILDNLQVDINKMKQEMETLGISVQEAFGRQVDEQMKTLGGYLETSKTAVEQLTVNWKEFKLQLAKKAETSWFTSFLNEVVTFFRVAVMSKEEFRKFMTEETAVKAAEATIDRIKKETKSTQELEKELDKEIIKRKELLKLKDEDIAREQKKITGSTMTTYGAVPVRNQQAEANIEAFRKQKTEIEQVIKILEDYEIQTYANSDADEDRVKSIDELVYKESEEIEILKKKWREQKRQEESYEALLKATQEASAASDAFRKSLIPTIEVLEDVPEPRQETLNAWEEFFAKLRVGFQELDEDTIDFGKIAEQIQNTGFNILKDQLTAQADFEAQIYDNRISKTEEYYDRLIELAGDNNRRKKELDLRRDQEIRKLEKQREEAETRAARRKILIEGAVAIAKVFSESKFPLPALIYAGLIAAQTASQIAILNRAPKGYAKGVIGLKGQGTETSDSIHAMLSRGESVMTAKETRENWRTLHQIRAGKINDKVIDRIMSGQIVVGSDDHATAAKLDELIKVNKANRPIDYVEKYGTLMRVERKSAISKKYIRSKYGLS